MNLPANSWERRELKNFLHGFTHLPSLAEQGPMIVERGEGIYVYDLRGRRYIEGNSGLWNIALGYNDPRLAEAAIEQYRKFPAYHTFFGRNNQPSVALAEKLVALAPTPISRVCFTNSGSEANETAVKALWMIHIAEGKPRKRKIISRKSAYHGATIFASSLTGKDYIAAFGLPQPEVVYAECPHHWRFANPGESETTYAQRLADNLEKLIQREGPETIAGFIAEPVMGAGGVITPPQGYFPAIQAVLRQHGIPFIADEVICGFGRTGRLWGTETYDIKPDIIVASKVLTAGHFPMGAVLVSPDIDRRLASASAGYEEFPHGFTTGGHPVGCAIALKALEIITEGGVLRNVQKVSPVFQDGVRRMASHPLVGEARGVGLMAALDIAADKKTKAAFPGELQVGERIAKAALDRGLIIRPIGTAVVLAPPFIITESQISDMLAILADVLDQVARDIRH